jgi:hypothetical protein
MTAGDCRLLERGCSRDRPLARRPSTVTEEASANSPTNERSVRTSLLSSADADSFHNAGRQGPVRNPLLESLFVRPLALTTVIDKSSLALCAP